MRTRVRTFAALLALLAFSASFAEQARAGTCAPAAAEAGHAGHGAELPAAPEQDRAPDGGDGCPLQAVAGGCAAVSFLSSAAEGVMPPPAPQVLVPPDADPSRELLLAASFFRPPQR